MLERHHHNCDQDHWSDQQSATNSFTIPSLDGQKSSNENNQQHKETVLNPNQNTANTITNTDAQSNEPIDQKPDSSLPNKIYNEIFGNYEMMICKLFYFLFYSAFGSLFPLIGIYFKQQGMSATETGILIGCRYIVEIFSAPFFATLADRFNRGKTILIGSLISWIILTSALAFIRPPAGACVSYNGSDFIMYQPYLEETGMDNDSNIRKRRSLLAEDQRISLFKSGWHHMSIQKQKLKDKLRQQQEEETENSLPLAEIQKFDQQMRLPPTHVIGKSPLTIEYAINYDRLAHPDYISPPFSHIVYQQSEVDEVFILLLLLMLIGEFFAAPTITLVDTVTIRQLSNNLSLNKYSKQRMFGSLGWALSMVIVGLALDNSTEFVGHPCGAHLRERNYSVCFKVFAFLMTIACIVATQFNFNTEGVIKESDASVECNEMNTRIQTDVNQQKTNLQNLTATASSTINQTRGKNFTHPDGKKRKFEFLDQWKSGVFAQRFSRRPEWFSMFKSITDLKLVALISLAWFFGTGVGLVFTFLFWHLQDLGGTPTLFAIASVLNHISEIFAYFYSLHYIKKFGHIRVLSLALFGNFLRFLYISYIDNSWLILPFELVQGITHATVWACFCSYLNHTMPEHSKNSSQVILQIVYSGLGKGLGSIIGGFLMSVYGTRKTFALFAFASLIAIFIFVLIMNVYKKQLAPTVNLGDRAASGRNRQNWLEDEKNRSGSLNTENEFVRFPVSPHGVPTAPIANRTTMKPIQLSIPIKTRVEAKINYNDDDLDDYITKNHRDWRITMNKRYD